MYGTSIPPSQARRIVAQVAFVIALAGSLSGLAAAQTVIVTTCDDEVDIPYYTGTIDDLPGPDGLVSLMEALIATDNTAGHQTIAFEIPQSEWYLPNIFPGQVVLYSMLGWHATDSLTIDGTTQTNFTGDTFPDGNELMLYGLTLNLGGDNCEFKGFHDSAVSFSGSGNDIQGNTGGMYITVYGGSGSTIHDNEAWTIKVDQSNDNVIVRNTTSRVRIDGWFDGGFPATNNRIGGPDPADRNFITGFGNYGEHGVPSGTTVELFDTLGTLVENNYIGTTPDGMSVGNLASTVGIGIENENRDLTIRNNLIVASAVGVYPNQGVPYGQPIYIEAYGGYGGYTSNVEIVGNTLGLDANGDPILGGVKGIYVSRYAQEYAYDVRIGGPNPGDGNIIAGHLSTGVFMEISPGVEPPPGVAIRVSGNSIHSHGEIGIDLTPNTWTFGPTPNDQFDADTGANGLQNYPEITNVARVGNGLRIIGTLHSSLIDDFTIELFASSACSPSGFGEGELYLGSTSVTTDAAGNAAFDVTVPGPVPSGWFITSTATLEPEGATSEFSVCFATFLVPDAIELSAANGGTINLELDAGDAHSGRNYLLVGSLSGTDPGTLLPGGLATIPLNRDWFTDYILARLNTAVFSNFWGTLDAFGKGAAQLNAPPIPNWVGRTIHFAYTLNNPWNFASNPVGVEVVP